MDFDILVDQNQSVPCLEFVQCATCSSTDCPMTLATLEQNLEKNYNLSRYGTELEYHCALGKSFKIGENFVETQTISCQWDGSWNDTVDLEKCQRNLIREISTSQNQT